jgi:protein-tyrosine-phosphatase
LLTAAAEKHRNAGRSRMAATLFNLYADRSGCRAISVGTQPADHVHPEVVLVAMGGTTIHVRVPLGSGRLSEQAVG